MLLVEGSSFLMGNSSIVPMEICYQYFPVAGGCSSSTYLNEEPQHTVNLEPFLIDQYEVSNAQYRQCVEAGVCRGPSASDGEALDRYYNDAANDNYPVVWVSWFDAQMYCEWRGARLPTEAEWEMAARGTDGRQFPWGDYYDPLMVNACDEEVQRGLAPARLLRWLRRGGSCACVFTRGQSLWRIQHGGQCCRDGSRLLPLRLLHHPPG